MNNVQEYKGTMPKELDYLKNSPSGGPRVLFRLNGFMFRTMHDSKYAIVAANLLGKRVIVTAGMHYGFLTVEKMVEDTSEHQN